MTTSKQSQRRILVCDDEAGVLDAYRRILADLTVSAGSAAASDFDALAAELFGDVAPVPATGGDISEIVYCRQGEDAVAAFGEAHRDGQPFAAVFLDVRMPPGMDGVEAARCIRAIDPAVNIVIVTGYSDHRPAEIAGIVGAQDRLFYLVKPFDADEVRQMATTLANRWSSDMQVAGELSARLAELEKLNSALKASEASAHYAARRDPLTSLLNRNGLQEQFALLAARAISGKTRIGFAYIDLDCFKQVNDVHGHGTGDRLIRDVAGRIEAAVGDRGLVARLGGDEFSIVCADEADIEPVMERVLKASNSPFVEGSLNLPVGLSIGYSKCDPRLDLSEIMRQADIALYAAKAAGRGVVRSFDAALDQKFRRNRLLAEDLKEAIAGDMLFLHYQPLMSADGNRVTGLEALLRWNHPSHGMVSPAIFVPIAEQNNLMCELGDWVLKQAMKDMRLWPDLVTSVNLSAAQFARPDFARDVIQLAKDQGITPSMVEFEITETALSQDMRDFAAQVEMLTGAGFKLALDDFGSGYASIGYLSQLYFNKLKIDRSFVSDLSVKPNADRMIRSIVNLGEAMGLTVTAEGVEEPFQHELLQSAGCDQMQGFLFHRPCSAEAVQALLSRQRQAERAA